MSQFIEMFGDAEKKPFVDVCINKGEYGSNSPADDYDGNIRYVRITDITEEGNLNSLVVSPRKVEEKYMLLRDDLLFARTGNTVGKTYLHRSGRMIFAGYLIRYRLNNKLMLPQFAFAYTHTNQYYDWVEKIKKVGAQPNISAAQYDSMPIPVPSMAKQIEFVSIAKQADKSGFDGFKSQFIEMFKDKKTNGKIADLVDTDIKSVKKSFNKDDLIEYIDISSVNAKSRTLNETTQYIVSSAPSRAQQCVQNGDILVSTVRPINRNVSVVDRDLTNLVASTGFCILRPKDGYREYLLAIVTSDKYTDKMCDIASGGLYPAVNNSDVLSYDIFIPDKDFLNRVTQIYRQADKSGSVLQQMIAC